MMSSLGCSLLSKRDGHNRATKQNRLAVDNFILGENFRRKKNYQKSLRYFYKSALIYKNKFDYEGEFRVLLKMGYIYSVTKNKKGFFSVTKRLGSISSRVKNGAYQIKEIEAKWSIENDESKVSLEKVRWLISNGDNFDSDYYKALYAKIIGFGEDPIVDKLVNASQRFNVSREVLEETKNPEGLLFINKVIANVSLKRNEKKVFDQSIKNCEKIINYFELIEYSNTISALKKRFNNES